MDDVNFSVAEAIFGSELRDAMADSLIPLTQEDRNLIALAGGLILQLRRSEITDFHTWDATRLVAYILEPLDD